MLRALFVFLICILFSACTQRMTCPAFQSAYIYDKEELRKKFSYFQDDSTPKVLTASRNKYLIAEAQSYKKKVRSLQSVAMKPVYVNLPDSLLPEDQRMDIDGDDGIVPGAELDLAARSVIDSIYIVDVPQANEPPAEDSVYVISRDREVRLLKYNTPDSLIYDASTGKYVRQKPSYSIQHITFNVAQDNYMWYLRDYLVLPDVRIARMQQNNKAENDSGKKAKKGIKGFFKNLFKKKNKDQEIPADTLAPKPFNENEDFDYVDEDEMGQPAQVVPREEVKEKKGLFSRKKKKEKAPKRPDNDTNEEESTIPEDDTPPVDDDTEVDSF